MRITKEMLERNEACTLQVARFVEFFPDGVEVTRELCEKHAADFEWAWAARTFFGPGARAAYYRAGAIAREAYEDLLGPAEKELERACTTARTAYKEIAAAATLALQQRNAVAFFEASLIEDANHGG